MSDTQQTDEQKLMFDERLNARFRDTAHISFLDVPELRSIEIGRAHV